MSRAAQSMPTPESRPWFRNFLHDMHAKKSQEKSQEKSQDEGLMQQDDGSSDGPKLSFGSSGKRRGGDIAAIFVHAGAGFHSFQNEKIHLKACEEACLAGMTFLRNGSTAVQAVEAAIKLLEDNEVTNAGYGSNLAMDGTVECDATVVDHFGRSGAVGAIRNVLNPIHVARHLLEESCEPLSLKRVPPNLLVGEGATDYAYEHGVPLLPQDYLISPGAKDRWHKWTRDLKYAQQLEQPLPHVDSRESAALRNEAQPGSPTLSGSVLQTPTEKASINFPQPLGSSSRSASSSSVPTKPRSPLMNDVAPRKSSTLTPEIKKMKVAEHSDDGAAMEPFPEGIFEEDGATSSKISSDSERPAGVTPLPQDDHIVDTVGAIAIDYFGNIAAGSSSGGIGMKHKGRMGPAALVGIGTAVHPVRVSDKNKTTAACVTSGTGEHMATTTAAATCAERVYANRKMNNSGSLESAYEDEAIRSFITNDFMRHPSLKHSHSAGAIGVMVVKKMVEGVYLYFGHNTESFAVASMSSEDETPQSVMSRLRGSDKSCSIGGRSLRYVPTRESKKRKSAAPQGSGTKSEAKKAKSPSTADESARSVDGNSSLPEDTPMATFDGTSETPSLQKVENGSEQTPPDEAEKSDNGTPPDDDWQNVESLKPVATTPPKEPLEPQDTSPATDTLGSKSAPASLTSGTAETPNALVRLHAKRVAAHEERAARWSRAAANRLLILQNAEATVQAIDARIQREGAPTRTWSLRRPHSPQREDYFALDDYMHARAFYAAYHARELLERAKVARAQARLVVADKGRTRDSPPGVGWRAEAVALRVQSQDLYKEARREVRVAKYAIVLPPVDVSSQTQAYARALIRHKRRLRHYRVYRFRFAIAAVLKNPKTIATHQY